MATLYGPPSLTPAGLLLTLALVTGLLISCLHSSQPPAFLGFQLLALHPQTREETRFVDHLRQSYLKLDFWQPPGAPRGCVVLVPEHLVQVVTSKINSRGIPWDVISDDIDRLIDAEESDVKTGSKSRSTRDVSDAPLIDHFSYKDLEGLEDDLHKLKASYPSYIDLLPLTHRTHEGREVIAVKVTGDRKSPGQRMVEYTVAFAQRICNFMFESVPEWLGTFLNGLNDNRNKSVIIIEGGMHAREWISPASLVYVIHSLVEGYQTDEADALFLLDFYELIFVPLANPDGYQYSHANRTNRFWRKNMRKTTVDCTGVDLNRNFDFHFATHGVSDNECSEVYHGGQAFSEPESRNIRDLFDKHKSRIVSFLSVHSYGQLILVPWCYIRTDDVPANYQHLTNVSIAMAQAINYVDNQTYVPGTLFDVLGDSVSGSSVDWALHSKPSITSFGLELRPSLDSNAAFLLPPREIGATGRELMASIKVAAIYHIHSPQDVV